MAKVIAVPPRQLAGYAIVATLLGILGVQYLTALPSAAQDDRTSSCRALNPMPFNPQIGKLPVPAPDFQAVDYKGQTTSLGAYRGKVVFLNFWQTTCPPCKDEAPSMEALAGLVGNPDFEMLALASEKGFEPVRRFFPNGSALTVLLDPPDEGQSAGKIARRFGTEKWPETYLIDKHGVVRYYFINSRRWDSRNAVDCVHALLAE
jgi:peroxiredoxin